MKKFLYWLVSCTWGIIMTAIGAVAALVLIIAGNKPKIFHYNVYFEVGRAWGGVNFGGFFFVNKNASLSTKQHEAGHGLQNIMLGVLMPFVVAIPSAIRCLIRKYNYTSKKVISGVITAVSAAVGVVMAVCGFVYSLTALGVIGLFVTLYAGILALWLFKREIPQYSGGVYVDYDKIWFEGDATRRGEAAFPE